MSTIETTGTTETVEITLTQLNSTRTQGRWGCRDLGHGIVVEKLNDDGSVDRTVPPIAWLGYEAGAQTEANAKLIALMPEIVDKYLRAAEVAVAINARLDGIEREVGMESSGDDSRGGGLHAVDPRRGLMVVSASRAETVDI